jgi:hypothetical protein
MVEFVTITGPAAWASYLINGDASGLEPGEQAKADAWLAREGVRRVVCDAPGEDEDSPQEPRFTWHMGLHCPELECSGGDALDYLAEPLAS